MTAGNGEVRELPKGWCLTTAIEVCIKVVDCHNKTAPYTDAGIKLIRTTNIRNGSIDLANTRFVDKPTYEFWSRRCPPEPGDIIFTREAPMAEVGMIPPEVKLCMGQRMMLLRADNKNLLGKYLLYALQSPHIHRYAEKVAVGTGVKHMRVRDVELLPILIAPLNEQHRIIEKIEELFSDVDKGVESLKTAQKQLKVYRQAVLKWAFEGKLTAEWRIKQAKSNLKTGAELLAQIKAERENRYRQQLAEWEAAVEEWGAIGKGGKKSTKPSKLKDASPLTEAELLNLPKLPDSWCWVRFGELVSSIRGGTTAVPIDNPTDYLILRSSSVRTGSIDYSDVRFLMPDQASDVKSFVKVDDLLFTRLNGTVDYVGNCSRVTEYHPNNLMYPDRLYCAKLLLPSMAKYTEIVFESPILRRIIERKAKSTAGHKRISIPDVLDMPFPLPNLEEIDVILLDLETKLSIVEKFEATIIENLQKAEALRQSILKQAFAGKLVPQDPNDEPAEQLLKRIRAERQAQLPPKSAKQLKIKGI